MRAIVEQWAGDCYVEQEERDLPANNIDQFSLPQAPRL